MCWCFVLSGILDLQTRPNEIETALIWFHDWLNGSILQLGASGLLQTCSGCETEGEIWDGREILRETGRRNESARDCERLRTDWGMIPMRNSHVLERGEQGEVVGIFHWLLKSHSFLSPFIRPADWQPSQQRLASLVLISAGVCDGSHDLRVIVMLLPRCRSKPRQAI